MLIFKIIVVCIINVCGIRFRRIEFVVFYFIEVGVIVINGWIIFVLSVVYIRCFISYFCLVCFVVIIVRSFSWYILILIVVIRFIRIVSLFIINFCIKEKF